MVAPIGASEKIAFADMSVLRHGGVKQPRRRRGSGGACSFGKKGGWVGAEGLFRGDRPRLVSQLAGQFGGFPVIELFVRLAGVIFIIVERFEVSIDTFFRIDSVDRGTVNASFRLSPRRDGLYQILEEIPGLRSWGLPRSCPFAAGDCR